MHTRSLYDSTLDTGIKEAFGHVYRFMCVLGIQTQALTPEGLVLLPANPCFPFPISLLSAFPPWWPSFCSDTRSPLHNCVVGVLCLFVQNLYSVFFSIPQLLLDPPVLLHPISCSFSLLKEQLGVGGATKNRVWFAWNSCSFVYSVVDIPSITSRKNLIFPSPMG